jgi:outer membrane protein assembly factor BamB
MMGAEGSNMAQSSLVYIGIAGTVLALDRATGQEVWRSTQAGGDFVNVVLLEGDLFATTKGELFCLDTATGHLRWQNPLKGLGRGLVTIAAPGAQQSAPIQEKKRRDEEAAAAAAATGAAT